MRFVLRSSSLICIFAFAFGQPSLAGVIRDDASPGDDNCPICQTMAAQAWYPGVGQVTWDESSPNGIISISASATYIGGGWILTAAHVADGTNNTGGGISNFKFLLGSNTYIADASVVGSFFVPSGWNGNLNSGQDIGLVHLTSSPNVLPANLYTQSDELGHVGTIIGYGYGGRASAGYNRFTPDLKRAGNNMLDVYGGASKVTGYSSNLVFGDFDNPNSAADSSWGSSTPLPYEFLPTLGDSGGGLFINVNGIDYLAGVDSVGTTTIMDGNVNSDYGDMAGFTRVSQFLSWIQSTTHLSLTQHTPILPGDYNGDGGVDSADYTIWRDKVGQVGIGLTADGDHDNTIGNGDYNVWSAHFGEPAGGSIAAQAVPEPAGGLLLASGLLSILCRRRNPKIARLA